MKQPTEVVEIKDPRAKITYRVVAFRTLTRDEAVAAIQAFNGQNKRKATKNSTVTIVTTIGAADV